jgi:UDP-N-acetylmuramate dehydrogenase
VTTPALVPLAGLTTLRVGGPANRLVEARSAGALLDAVRDADARGEPVLLLGGGSNVVISDAGFAGLAVLIRTTGVHRSGGRLVVAAGQSWDELVAYAVTERLSGIECLAGIPGLVGATPIQNVGAYGQEVSDVIVRVQAFDRARGEVCDLTPPECGFGYRTSRFKLEPDRWVVTEVEFALEESPQSQPVRYGELSRRLGLDPSSDAGTAPLAVVRDAVLALRRGKGMVLDPADPDTASAGSFFTNPVLDAGSYQAGALVVQACAGHHQRGRSVGRRDHRAGARSARPRTRPTGRNAGERTRAHRRHALTWAGTLRRERRIATAACWSRWGRGWWRRGTLPRLRRPTVRSDRS